MSVHLAFPWAGEGGLARPHLAVSLDKLLFAYACVQHRFHLHMEALRIAEQ